MDVTKHLFFRLFFTLILSSLTLDACAYAQESHSTPPWVMDSTSGKDQWTTENTRARVVIFRLTNSQDKLAKKPYNIFLNGNYHASLLAEHQAVALSLCPGKKTLSVVPGKVDGVENNPLRTTEETPQLQAGSIYFYQISTDGQGKISTRWVDHDLAEEVLANVKVQAHTISRVVDAQACPTEIYTISTSALFKLDRHDRSGLIPGALQTLQTLAERIRTDYISLDKIAVKGYADPLGDIEYNQTLSEARAKTISALLKEVGLPENIITSEGMGPTHLVVSDCQARHLNRNQLIQCNQPNRRVEVEIYGKIQKAEG